jgi:CRISPR system Cascade subunit CasA
MSVENRFNLIDEPWIPVVDEGLVSLKQLFIQPNYRALGGNPVHKIALTKLLLAIAQAAYTPSDDENWTRLQPSGLAVQCLAYLDKWHDSFYLYGEKPFLQMPILEDLIKDETPKSFGAGFYPDVLLVNSTILTQTQIEKKLCDAEKAIFVTSIMNFALGGKRIHKNIPPLTPNYPGKTKTAKSSPSLGNYVGYLHSYLVGDSVQETIWLNLLTLEQIQDTKIWKDGLGKCPWEEMPVGENCNIAQRLKNSYMGCLVALSRFVLLKDDGIFYIEGIQYPSHKEGWFEPSISMDRRLNVEKKPWRELTSLLSFLKAVNHNGFDCLQLRFGFQRIKSREKPVGIWSGGLKVRGTSGDQSVKQDDDFIESYVVLPSPYLITGKDSIWFNRLSEEMDELDKLSKIVYGSTFGYFKNQNMESKEQSAQASNLFWQLCERQFQALLDACDDVEKVRTLRSVFARYVNKSYDNYCSRDTARQLDAWAKNRPNLSNYLKKSTKEVV